MAHKGFPKAINVVDFMYELAGSRAGPQDIDRMKAHIAKQLRGLCDQKITFRLNNLSEIFIPQDWK